jgi:uncharacterized protein (DUF1015 family)
MNIRAFQAVVPNLDRCTISEKFFESVRDAYPEYEEQGFFSEDQQKAVFLYEIKHPKITHHGIITAVEVLDYEKNKIKKHEKTILAKERQQMALLLERGAMVKPVLLTHPPVAELSDFSATFRANHAHFLQIYLSENQQTHTFWKVDAAEDIIALQTIFAQKVPVSYVADGHHRLTTNVLLHKSMCAEGDGEFYDDFLVAFFAADELRIEAFNRIVEIETDNFLQKINNVATPIAISPTPTEKHHFSIFHQKEWHSFTWKKEILAKIIQQGKTVLDVDILNEKVLKKILGIKDIRKDNRITYVEGIKGTAALEKICLQKPSSIAFSLFPVAIEDLMEVADSDGTMPPKSTWFEPRMKNGILMQKIA